MLENFLMAIQGELNRPYIERVILQQKELKQWREEYADVGQQQLLEKNLLIGVKGIELSMKVDPIGALALLQSGSPAAFRPDRYAGIVAQYSLLNDNLKRD